MVIYGLQHNPYAPWCWNIYLHFPLSKITQFCRFLYTSTMVRIWVMLGYKPILVGGIPTPLKNMSSSMGRMTTHILWKIKFMFQTTNQIPSGYLT